MAQGIAIGKNTRDIVVIQDYTQIKTVGSANQQMAGHILDTDSFGGGSPEAIWRLDDLTDDSGNSNTLTNISSTPFTATDPFGNASSCADFDGSADCLHATGTAFDDTGSFSTGAWIYPHRGSGTNEMIISKLSSSDANRSFYLMRGNSGTELYLMVYYNDSGGYVPTKIDDYVIPQNEWSFVCGVYNQSAETLELYVNGEVVASVEDSNLSSRNNSSGADLTIGAYDGSGTPDEFFDGRISNAFYAKYAMTSWEIQQKYAVRYSAPSNIAGTDYHISCLAKTDNDSDFIHQVAWPEIARDSNYIYRAARAFDSDDYIRIIARS